jgi:hypothetical protein
VERHHDLEAAGLDAEEVELFDGSTESPTADLLDDPHAVVRVYDFVAYLEGHHVAHLEGTAPQARSSLLKQYKVNAFKRPAAMGLRVG